METYHIEKIILPYQKEELHAWKSRDPRVVPPFALRWKGPGVSNGYGFGEWKAEHYFRGQGFYVINNDFNLLSKKSKFAPFNECIISFLGKTKAEELRLTVQELIQQGYSIENPDLFIFSLNSSFFVEVKKGKDILRKPQICFMYLVNFLLGVESKLVYLSDKETIVRCLTMMHNMLTSWVGKILVPEFRIL